MPRLFQENEVLLQEGISLLENLPAEIYTLKPNDQPSSPGEHFRHIIEHYQMFLKGMKTGQIDYDRRERNSAIETSSILAIELLQAIQLELQSNEIPFGPILVSQNYNPEYPKPMIPSSVERELLFLSSHTVHHYAIIAMVLKESNIAVSKSFGYSQATLYAKEQMQSKT
ncbi:DinB family protein [Leptospira kemamanensis]|uniref:DinB family protein n=1 Tax=Leptospira kemamanensis TaxID=2484942 RepID=A0A4R9JQL8_9LEPT|nr:DinB family protein [Leptospira kemamanensis]TGL52994.1 DinB family protein [Leptospira kemamanensis]